MGFIPSLPLPLMLREQLLGDLGEEGICNGNTCRSEALGTSAYPVWVCSFSLPSPPLSIPSSFLGQVLRIDLRAPQMRSK